MQAPRSFDLAVQAIVARQPEYAAEAYHFIHESLNATTLQLSKDGAPRHLSAEELYFGSCMQAIKEYGPLAGEVLYNWGIENSSDIGALVYNLIEEGVFGKQKEDAREQFDHLPDLMDLLDRPFADLETPNAQ